MRQKSGSISTIINTLVTKYIQKYHNETLHSGGAMKCSSAYEINNGLCMDFSSDVLQAMMYFKNSTVRNYIYELSSDMFVTDDIQFAQQEWGNIIFNNDLAWSSNLLHLYGYPPTLHYLPSHVWIYYKGKHYDAECPGGVRLWFELPIFMRLFQKILMKKKSK